MKRRLNKKYHRMKKVSSFLHTPLRIFKYVLIKGKEKKSTISRDRVEMNCLSISMIKKGILEN